MFHPHDPRKPRELYGSHKRWCPECGSVVEIDIPTGRYKCYDCMWESD